MEEKKVVETKEMIEAKNKAKKKVDAKKKADAKKKTNAKKKLEAKKTLDIKNAEIKRLADAKKIEDAKKMEDAIEKAVAERMAEAKKVVDEENKKLKKENKFTNKIISTKASKIKRDMNELVSVINLTSDRLIYVSKAQLGYEVEWDGYLAENHMEYKELVNMRNSQVAFFKNTWVLCDQDVLEDLKIERFYKDLFELDDMDILLSKPHNELGKILEKIALSTKRLIADYAFKLKKEGNVLLDSTSLVKLIEEKLDIDLTL